MKKVIIYLCLFISFLLFAANTPKCFNTIDGKALYKTANCAACHGRKGKSMLNIAPSLRNPKLTLAQRIEVITNGSKKDATMVAFSPKFNKSEIKAIAVYTMTFIK